MRQEVAGTRANWYIFIDRKRGGGGGRKLSNGNAFFHLFQTSNLIGGSKNFCDGTMMVQEDNKGEMEILCK